MATKTTPFSPSLASKLAKLGINQPQDFWWHLPLRYENRSELTPLAGLVEGPALIEAEVIATQIQHRPRRQLACVIQQGQTSLTLRFFHFYPSLLKTLPPGKQVRVYGHARQSVWGWEMVHPEILPLDAPLDQHWTPIYPTGAGISQKALRQRLLNALAKTAPPIDLLPEELRQELALWPLSEALSFLHHPSLVTTAVELEERRHPAWQRIKWEEFLVQQLALRRYYQTRQKEQGIQLPAPLSSAHRLLAQLPFQLTDAQNRVTQEIYADLVRHRPMYRLVQGDVGSGKTIVAALAAWATLVAEYQVAFMAPTELLAQQHYQKLKAWFTPLNVPVLLLSSSLGAPAKRAVNKALEDGKPALIIGTHALFQAAVSLPKLALVIIDEQHRFGVQQRLALLDKGLLQGPWRPHQLMMSATPIPRTLAMSQYADLDVSTIDQLPPGRTPVVTRIFSQSRLELILDRMKTLLQRGEQAYWVCPLIETSEKVDLQAAEVRYQQLQKSLPEFTIRLLHGRQKQEERSATMQAFVDGSVHLLVATTVIEVGVDVPNATLMIIEHAERFGLAQLHQLRGRVGRGRQDSFCLLLYAEPLSNLAKERLKILRDSQDGFLIAEADLALRGPGELLGPKQSGTPSLRYADLIQDASLLALAASCADRLLLDYPAEAEAYLTRFHTHTPHWAQS